ncbi:hypothetical protein K440DRAFT_614778 [Wilcoxina mikolae CBS 423.85]|nr:hypothetical protein K440DRAFT_614778 [Wilcoxina mikolae CBS 423.85]
MKLLFLCLFFLYTCLPTQGFQPGGVAFEPATIVIPEHMLSGSGTKSLRLHEATPLPKIRGRSVDTNSTRTVEIEESVARTVLMTETLRATTTAVETVVRRKPRKWGK